MSILPISSRRRFVAQLGRIASLSALSSIAMPHGADAAEPQAADEGAPGDWDFSWVSRLSGATDRGVFDWNEMETPPEATPIDYAARYLDGCESAYGSTAAARAVLVIRASAIPAALNDAAWGRYAIGATYQITDPVTRQPAARNPFWSDASHGASAPPNLQELVGRGVIVLACNVALTHMASRLARAYGQTPAEVHQALIGALVPNGFAVPSGIFGLVRAQNAGCGLVRV